MSKLHTRPYFQQGDVAFNQLKDLMIWLGCTSPKQVFVQAIALLYHVELQKRLKVADFGKNSSRQTRNVLD